MNFLVSCKFSKINPQWFLHPLRFPRFRGTETSGARGCNRSTVLWMPHLSLPWGRVLNPLPSPRPFQKGKGCNRPPVLGTASLYGWRGIKALAMFCGMGPPGNSRLQLIVYCLQLFCGYLLITCRFLVIFLVVMKTVVLWESNINN